MCADLSTSMEWRLEAFESRPSLWKFIGEYVPESERIEIKEALGEDLVDETLDLHNEVGYIYMYMYVFWRLCQITSCIINQLLTSVNKVDKKSIDTYWWSLFDLKSQYKSIIILKLVFISLCVIALYWSIIIIVLLCDS